MCVRRVEPSVLARYPGAKVKIEVKGDPYHPDTPEYVVPTDTERNLAVALAHAAAGVAGFPCEPVDRELPKGDVIKAKAPKPGIMWRTVSSTNEATIRGWFKRWPDAITGIDLAKSELVVVDTDRHNADKDGVAALSALEMANDVLPEHPIVRTRGNGQHHYFLNTAGRGNGRGQLPDGIDVRGNGGYVIAAGSVTPEGSWVADPDAPELPQWLVDIIRAPKAECPETAAPGSGEARQEALHTPMNVGADMLSALSKAATTS